jgi:hypothetical protein
MRLHNAICILGFALLSNTAKATTCFPTSELVARAEVVFSAVARRISLEPAGTGTPEIAIQNLPISEGDFVGLPPGAQITVDGCAGSFCFSWTGTREDLPATQTLTWVQIEVDIKDVWRGNVRAQEAIYAAGTQLPPLGDLFLMAFPGDRTDPLSFRGPCQPLLLGQDLEEFRRNQGDPLYSYN